MEVHTDDCDSSSILVGSGAIHVILVMNMKRWIDQDSVGKFLRLRDSEGYARYLQSLPKHIDNSKFRLSEDTEELEQIGYDLGVFRAYALENLFMPTFQWVPASPPPLPATEQTDSQSVFRTFWNDWPIKKIRLSRGGTISVKLEREFHEEPLTSIAETVLGLEHLEPRKIVGELEKAIAEGDNARIEQLGVHLQRGAHHVWGAQWQIAREMVRQFLQSLSHEPAYANIVQAQVLRDHPRLAGKFSIRPNALVWHNEQNPEQDFFINTTEPKDEETHPLRDRYVIFDFSKLAEDNAPNIALSPEQIQSNACHCESVSSLLEGVILGQTGKNPIFSKFKDQVACNFASDQDLATWQNEMCLLTLDNGLIYHHSDHAFPITQEISFPDRQVKHEQYWGSIIRGIEHLMDVRVQAQMMAGETAERLVEAAEFTRQARHTNNTFDNKNAQQTQLDEKIQRFAVNVSYLAGMVAHLRNSTSPTALAKADYAVNKFESWLNTSQISRTLADANTNLREINTFLSHYDDTRLSQESLMLSKKLEDLQQDAQSTNDLTLLMTAMFSGIMALLSFLSLPSFTADLGRPEIPALFPQLSPYTVLWGWIGILFFAVSIIATIVLVILACLRIWAGRKRRNRPLIGLRYFLKRKPASRS